MSVTESHDNTSGTKAIPKTRISSAWVALSAGMLSMVIVLVFILQNLRNVTVHFLTAQWRIPLGIDLLFAVILGGLIVFSAGSIRILQLRRLARGRGHPASRHHRRSETVATPEAYDVDVTDSQPARAAAPTTSAPRAINDPTTPGAV